MVTALFTVVREKRSATPMVTSPIVCIFVFVPLLDLFVALLSIIVVAIAAPLVFGFRI
jgi:hypothetical protein